MWCFVGDVCGNGDGVAEVVVRGHDTQSCMWRGCVVGGWYKECATGSCDGIAGGARMWSDVVDGHLCLVVGQVELEADGVAFCRENVRDRDSGVDGSVGIREGEDNGNIASVGNCIVGCW